VQTNPIGRFSENLLGREATVSDGVIFAPASNVEVSRRGIAVTSSVFWEPGTMLTIRSRMRSGRSAVARAVVVRWDTDAMELRVIASGPAFSRAHAAALAFSSWQQQAS